MQDQQLAGRQEGTITERGFDDLLVGYPAYNEQDIAAIVQATAAGTHITLMVDCLEHVEQVEKMPRSYHKLTS